MAKLTLSFKDRKLKVYGLPSGDCLIGRDNDCTVQIDSLAVAPRHARVRSEGDGFVLEALDSGAQTLVNGAVLGAPCALTEGDQIQIGKHTLSFSMEGEGTAVAANVTRLPDAAWLQIQNGSHLGRTIRLDKAFTRIGKPDGNLAVIAHRGNGYYLCHLQGGTRPLINDQDIGDRARRLEHNDSVSVGDLRVQFFEDQAHEPPAPGSSQADRPQRRFTRIPFEVPVTLGCGDRSWESQLVDISLHGALIKTPASWQQTDQEQYQLSIHLDGGHEIGMDVVVAHRQENELGLRCVDIDVESITHLRRLIELNLGEPELLERELSALG